MTTALRWMPSGAAAPRGPAMRAPDVNPVVRAALYLFVLSIPFEMPHRSIPIEVPTLTGYVFLASTFLNPSACYRKIPAPLFWFGLHLWLLTVLTVFLGVAERRMAIIYLANFTQLLLLCWTMYNAMASPRVFRGVLIAIVVSCAARAAVQVLGIASTSYTVWTGGERVTSFGQNPNLAAIILAVGLTTVVGLRFAVRSWSPRLGILTWPLAAVIGLAVIQTGSRGGLLAAALGLVPYCAAGRTVGQRARNALLGVLALGALALGALNSPMMRNRLENAEAGNLAGRERIYPALVTMFVQRPLLGWGPVQNEYQLVRQMEDRTRPRRGAHNLVLGLLTTSGIVGATPFLIGLALCLAAAWRARRGPLAIFPIAVLAVVFAGNTSGDWIEAKVLWLALTIALAAGAYWPATSAPEQRAETPPIPDFSIPPQPVAG